MTMTPGVPPGDSPDRLSLPIYASIAPPAEIRISFQVPPGGTVRNPVIRIQEVHIESIPFDLTWLPDLIHSTKSEIVSEINKAHIELVSLIKDQNEVLRQGISADIREDLEKYLSQDLVRKIGNELVGETYLRWDTRVRYYPSVVFLFLEPEYNFVMRKLQVGAVSQKKTQIKIRVEQNLLNNDDNDINKWIKDFQNNFENFKTLQYSVGNVKCNYVHSGSISWKTSISCPSKEEGNSVLSSLCSLLKITYDPDQLSVTFSRNSKTETELITVELFKVVLLINGQPKPYVLYHK